MKLLTPGRHAAGCRTSAFPAPVLPIRQRQRSLPGAMRILRLPCLLAIMPAMASPGDPLPGGFPEISSQATVTATAPLDDGSVYLLGDFDAVDGIPRPGLARLLPTGENDSSFHPAFPAPPAESSLVILPFPHTDLRTPRDLFPLPGGPLIVGPPVDRFIDPDGSENPTLRSRLPERFLPLFATSERLYLLDQSAEPQGPAEFKVYRLPALTPDPDFTPPQEIRFPFDATPAPDGKVLVLERFPATGSGWGGSVNFRHQLHRLLPDGSGDPSFVPPSLDEGFVHAFSPARGDGFHLLSLHPGSYLLWPSPSDQRLVLKSYSADGTPIGTTGFGLPFGVPPTAFVMRVDGALVSPDASLRDIVVPGGVADVPLATPDRSATIPPGFKTLDSMSDGTLLVGGTRRFLPDGSPDPGWHTPRLSRPPTVRLLTPAADGVLVAGDFDQADGAYCPGIALLAEDGTLDPGFLPATDFRTTRRVHQRRDGSVVALTNGTFVDDGGNRSRLVRFDPETSTTTVWPPPEAGLSASGVVDFAPCGDDALLIYQAAPAGDVSRYSLDRVLADGKRDPSFSGFSSFSPPANPAGPFCLADDRFLFGSAIFNRDGTPNDSPHPVPAGSPMVELADGSVLFDDRSGSRNGLIRWHPTSGPHPTFFLPLEGRPLFAGAGRAVTSTRGKVAVIAGGKLSRHHSTGQIDPAFRCPEAIDGGLLDLVAVTPDGAPAQLWVCGDFPSPAAGMVPGIAALEDSHVSGFAEWIAAAAPSNVPNDYLQESADPDGDGCSNLLEYAASTDAFAARSHSHPRRTGPLRFALPCNPEAPEIVRTVQASTNLIDWHVAGAAEVRLETGEACYSWSILRSGASLYTRVRVTSAAP